MHLSTPRRSGTSSLRQGQRLFNVRIWAGGWWKHLPILGHLIDMITKQFNYLIQGRVHKV